MPRAGRPAARESTARFRALRGGGYVDGDALFPHLFQPLKIGAIEVRNRILSSAHQTGLAEDGVPGERYVAYQRERARGGGLDGVELLFAFGLLVAAFMSPYANHRTDRWGGSLENRLRFPLAVLDAVRARAGRDFVVGLRIPGDELVPGGLDRAHMLEIAQRFDATGQIDYLNVIAGNNLERFARIRHWPPTPAPHGLFAELAAGIKRVVTVPVFCVGRVTDPAMAEEIVARGDADMVGMTRAQIADPHLVRKARAGRLDEIRPCVGANVCVNRNLQGLSIRCIHNPDIGHEAEWAAIAPAAMAKHVAVIGGGPAELEAARVAAARGHRVTLLE